MKVHRLLKPLLGALALACVTATQAQVGFATLKVGEMPVTLVYPTAEAARPVPMGPFQLEVAPDAAPTPGRHRLVVVSHGTGGSALADHQVAAALARAGFVVAHPLHQGDNFQDTSKAGPDSWKQRPAEVSRVIDALGADPKWAPLLALDKVGVHGISAGGLTALSLAGAQWRVVDMVRHCLANGDADFGFCFNGVSDPQRQAERRKRYESARGVPEAFLPADILAWNGGRSPAAPGADVRPDPRVAAVSLAVPLAAPFSSESLARIAVPVGVVRAGRDGWLAPAFHADRVLKECSRCRLLHDLPAAGHVDLLSPFPAPIAQAIAAQQPRGGAAEPGFDPRERAAAFAAVVAFHQRELGAP